MHAMSIHSYLPLLSAGQANEQAKPGFFGLDLVFFFLVLRVTQMLSIEVYERTPF